MIDFSKFRTDVPFLRKIEFEEAANFPSRLSHQFVVFV